MRETQVHIQGWEVPQEKEMATHSGFLAGESHGQRSLAGYGSWDHMSGHDLVQFYFLYFK